MCALRNGCSIASTMGFSVLDGLPMGTRCGQIDPGVLLYLMDQKAMGLDELTNLLYLRSGLKGLSNLSHDMRALEASGSEEARGAIDYFICRARREIGALTAAIDGLDLLVFTGGIGENAWQIRASIMARMDWFGLELDEAANRNGSAIISTPRSKVKIRVISTDEELMLAEHTLSTASGPTAQDTD
jgi:acetate kinase